MNILILGLDVNRSDAQYRAERLEGEHPGTPPALDGLPQVEGWGIRLSLADVKGISAAELERIVEGRPYVSLSDFWARARVSEPVVERLILAGGFDSLYRIAPQAPVQRRGRVTRRDLLLALADLHRVRRVDERTRAKAKGRRRQLQSADPAELAWAQGQGERRAGQGMQSALDFGDGGGDPTADVVPTGLPEMNDQERLKAELEILGLDASAHIVGRYLPLLRALGVASSRTLLQHRNQAEVLVAGVKVATQTPPVRSGRRVIFLTLDDSTGPVDTTFFEDVQGPYAATVFSSWLLLVRGEVRRTGPRGISIRATGAWDLGLLEDTWRAAQAHGQSEEEALGQVYAILDEVPQGYSLVGTVEEAGEPFDKLKDRRDKLKDRRDELKDRRGELKDPQGGPAGQDGGGPHEPDPEGFEPPPDPQRGRAGGMGRRRVLVHASGFKQSPYSDIKPAGTGAAEAPRKLWHSSPGSSGR